MGEGPGGAQSGHGHFWARALAGPRAVTDIVSVTGPAGDGGHGHLSVTGPAVTDKTFFARGRVALTVRSATKRLQAMAARAVTDKRVRNLIFLKVKKQKQRRDQQRNLNQSSA